MRALLGYMRSDGSAQRRTVNAAANMKESRGFLWKSDNDCLGPEDEDRDVRDLVTIWDLAGLMRTSKFGRV